ncbi:guanylate kinase [Propionispora vibrioides]|jgi:guanylate kinase|uniref:Guanylate kinase n=1 Tax=Propionispora vibrioides TaxID=112903 RepID=A0A1H8NN81_9FIRM|nr:guanylate kinase [Propionispora vibrioides]SEO31080.1 guanylate kinase [Propionispora vibrioides]
MTQQGILIVLSGPSGAGKGTICKELLRSYPNLHYSVSATTRAARAGEVHGTNYWFVSQEEFQEMIAKDDLLEWANVYGNCYGTPRQYVMELLNDGKDVILEIDTQGAMQIKNKFPEGVFIYIIPPSLNELANRIYKRGTDSLESIKTRLSCATFEIDCAQHYNYVVVNDLVEEAVRKISAIITAEKCNAKRNTLLVNDVCCCKTAES